VREDQERRPDWTMGRTEKDNCKVTGRRGGGGKVLFSGQKKKGVDRALRSPKKGEEKSEMLTRKRIVGGEALDRIAMKEDGNLS